MKLSDLELVINNENEMLMVCKDLLQKGLCARCTMRFLGEKRHSVYACDQDELRVQYFSQSPDEKIVPEFAEQQCPACIGILQNFACQDFYQQVINKIKEADYEYRDYQFSLMLPVATIIRQHAVFVYLVQKYESIYQGKEDSIPSIKDVFKWCAGYGFSQMLGVQFQMRSSFDILLNFNYPPSDQECQFLSDIFPDTFRKRKVQKGIFETFSRASVQKVLGNMAHSDFSRQSLCPLPPPKELCTCEISVSHDSLFVAGRYQKYTRLLSQTPWVVDGVTRVEGSVQEIVCQVILNRFKPTDHKFSASGREDVDVKMLGTGRPFVAELIDPHKVFFSADDMKAMQNETNKLTDTVAIRDLQIVTREDVGRLKEGEEDKSKSYVAVCWCQRPLTQQDVEKLNNTKDLTLYQRTPVRVLHRRALATRERKIYSMRLEPTEGLQFNLHLCTQAGTYVKEFVHGDFGRTQPNLGTLLGADCDILALDVTAVNIDWPPRIDPVDCSPVEKVTVSDEAVTSATPPEHQNHNDHQGDDAAESSVMT